MVEGTLAPSTGWVFLAGGGALPRGVMARFVELAGGPDALIVVIPTASGRLSSYHRCRRGSATAPGVQGSRR